jgi:hypothetical protein
LKSNEKSNATPISLNTVTLRVAFTTLSFFYLLKGISVKINGILIKFNGPPLKITDISDNKSGIPIWLFPCKTRTLKELVHLVLTRSLFLVQIH